MFVLSDIGDSLIFILLKPDHLFFTNNNTGKIRLILSIKKRMPFLTYVFMILHC